MHFNLLHNTPLRRSKKSRREWNYIIRRRNKYHKRSSEALLGASKEVRLEVNAERTKYILLFCHQIERKYHNAEITNRSFENVANFKHLGTILKRQKSNS
jgi:hypothetical protein